jgi:homoserine kinase
MAKSIQFDPKKLDELIEELKQLDTKNTGSGAKAAALQGKGASVSALHDTDKEYDKLASSMQTLFDNTIAFLSKAKTSMTASDEASGQQFNGN